MIALKLPADAGDHPYHLAEIIMPEGKLVSKVDPVFRLVRAGTQKIVTVLAPFDGKVGKYLIGKTSA